MGLSAPINYVSTAAFQTVATPQVAPYLGRADEFEQPLIPSATPQERVTASDAPGLASAVPPAYHQRQAIAVGLASVGTTLAPASVSEQDRGSHLIAGTSRVNIRQQRIRELLRRLHEATSCPMEAARVQERQKRA